MNNTPYKNTSKVLIELPLYGKYSSDVYKEVTIGDHIEEIYQLRPIIIDWNKAEEYRVTSLVKRLEQSLLQSQGLIRFLHRDLEEKVLASPLLSGEEAYMEKEHLLYEIDIANTLIIRICQLMRKRVPTTVNRWDEQRKLKTLTTLSTILQQVHPFQVDNFITSQE